MDLYIVSSAAYLLTALCLRYNENRGVPADLLVINSFPHAEEYAKKMRETGCFHKVDLVDKRDFDQWGQLYCKHSDLYILAVGTLFRRFPRLALPMYRNYAFSKRVYQRTFAPGNMPALMWYQLYLIQKHQCKIYLFDSGLGTRSLREPIKPGKRVRLMRWLGCLFLEDSVQGRYYFEVAGANPMYGKPLQQILLSQDNWDLVRTVQYCFDYHADTPNLLDHDVIFMQQCFDVYEQYQALCASQRETWQEVLRTCPEAVVCMHPRTKERYEPEHTFSAKAGLCTYDVNCMFAEHLEQKVLLTCFSNALLVPKHMFGKEPYLVFVYKLLNANEFAGMTIAQWDGLIARSVTACYSDPGKVYIPCDIAELRACLAEIAHRRKP